MAHLHSRHSDGTGQVDQIAAAAARSGVDVVLLTDHDTLAARRAGEEGWHGDVLVLVGEEISPVGRDHTLAFGVEEHVRHRGLTAGEICAAVSQAGGVAFAAHPFSQGSRTFKRFGSGTPYSDLRADGLTGIELWSFVVDTAEALTSIREAVLFVASPNRVLLRPPEHNMAAWDALCRERRLVAIGGIDAHQVGLRIGRRTPIRLMSYARSFRHLRTHVLCDRPPTGELSTDGGQVLEALRAGRCYLAVDSLAPARGFSFWAERPDGAHALPMGSEAPAGGWTLRVELPRPARLRLLRDGTEVASADAATLDHIAEPGPGVYRVEADLTRRGRPRAWIVSNPIYLR